MPVGFVFVAGLTARSVLPLPPEPQVAMIRSPAMTGEVSARVVKPGCSHRIEPSFGSTAEMP